jgi:glycine dehydrogenase subunit 1
MIVFPLPLPDGRLKPHLAAQPTDLPPGCDDVPQEDQAAGGHMTRFTSVTIDERRAMLDEIGVADVDELFGDVPEHLLLGRELELPAAVCEDDVLRELSAMADRNVSTASELCFLGAGMYDHYVPAVVDAIVGRAEFLTPYTPYQPEVSQGTLQAMFEYQTAISELTGLPVSNASVYDGASAVAAAAYLAKLSNGRRRLVVSRGLHPHARQTLETHAVGYDMEVVEVALDGTVTDGAELRRAMSGAVSAVFVQQPNFLGAIEDVAAVAVDARSCGALLVCSADPMTLGVLEAPGHQGADVVVGEGQAMGGPLSFGGPSLGFFAARADLIRQMPGRIAGETVDIAGRRGWVTTLQTREQHIRRAKATSNICTAQSLNALAAIVYLSWLGRDGLVELGERMLAQTAYCRRALATLGDVEAVDAAPVVREFTLRLPVDGLAAVQRVHRRCAAAGVNPGYPLGRDYPELADCLLVAITERRTRADIERLAVTLDRALAPERLQMSQPQVAA